MSDGYFKQLVLKTPTEFWINNPTLEQAAAALELGAVGITTNPTYLTRMAQEDASFGFRLSKAITASADDEVVWEQLYCDYIRALMRLAQPLHQSSGGKFGYVAIQGNPRRNDDPDFVLSEAHKLSQLGPNLITKVPATPAGACAMTELTALGRPTIATLGFSVDQAIFMAEAYRQGLKPGQPRPRGYVTYIAGILDDYLTARVKERTDAVLSAELIKYAGCQSTKVAYRIYQQRGYEALLMGGGARGPHHFTELVGGHLAITIGWPMARELEDMGAARLISRINADAPSDVVEQLNLLPDYVRASSAGALKPEEFTQFGPVAMFQNSFLKAYDQCLRIIAEKRTMTVDAGGKA